MGDIDMGLAHRELTSWSLFKSKSTKLTNAAEYYLSAANKFKTRKEYKKSGHAFEEHAKALQTLGGSMFKICDSYKHAAVQFKLDNDPKASEMYDKAVTVLCDQGKHSEAAKMCQQMGELSAKAHDYDESIMHYEKAADLYQSDDYAIQARRCLEKIAEFSVTKDPANFSKAADLFEEIAKTCLEARISRSVARKHFFRAVICIIAANDAVLAREKGELFLRLDPSLGTGREGKLMMTLVKALEDFDFKAFVQSVTDYNDISKFDAWHVKVLLAGRGHLSDPDEPSPDGVIQFATKHTAAPAATSAPSLPAAAYSAAASATSTGAAAASATSTGAAAASATTSVAHAETTHLEGTAGIDDGAESDDPDDIENFFG